MRDFHKYVNEKKTFDQKRSAQVPKKNRRCDSIKSDNRDTDECRNNKRNTSTGGITHVPIDKIVEYKIVEFSGRSFSENA